MLGVKDNGTPDPSISWIDLSPERDEFEMRRAYVHLKTTSPDDDLWNEMDEAIYQVAERLGGGDSEFWVIPLHTSREIVITSTILEKSHRAVFAQRFIVA